MKIPIYQIDAFTDRAFGGNPAAVCPLEDWLPDELLRRIAEENAVPETAFFIPSEEGYHIRWFTPDIEMDLCGHATLAAAHVIIRHLHPERRSVRFRSASGELTVRAKGEFLAMDLPSRMPEAAEAPQIILEGFSERPVEVLKARDYLLVFQEESIIRKMKPDRAVLDRINLDPGGIIVTAPGEDADFVSRFFTPQASIFEDPVTGSAPCSLIPYWSERLGRDRMSALQLSRRGGRLECLRLKDRVEISGLAVCYMEGVIRI
jgi:PhzF family phenazine biosynthesis protein